MTWCRAALIGVAIVVFASSCGGRDDPAATPTPEPTVAIAPATAPAAPTPTSTPDPVEQAAPEAPAPTEASGPTAPPGADPTEDEAAVIAAWERFLDLGMQARGKSPSDAALALDTYMTGDALEAWSEGIESDRTDGIYIVGSMRSSRPQIEFRDGAAVLDMCIETEWYARELADDSMRFDEGSITYPSRSRLTLVTGNWLVAATEFGSGTCVL